MAYVADLHIHSRYSRACSPQLNIPNLAEWAKLKGINLLGTGDFLHPLWFAELKSQLKEDGSGFLKYQEDLEVRFVLSVEIASIYSHKGQVRRVHNLVLLPTFEVAQKLQQALFQKRATLSSDGRPIVGIPSKDLLSMTLQASEKALFIPAHAWTPWFGIFGSESGYDSLADCFEDLTDKVLAIETGLSSDPAMNWRISELDDKSIVSFSDAHSLPNLGREATVFDLSELTYDNLWRAVKKIATPRSVDMSVARNDRVIGTIEFYPEEGKYHYTGHRNCGVKYSPEDTKAKGTICPKCGRGLTVGVMERVEEIATRSADGLRIKSDEGIIKSQAFAQRPGYRMLVPLMQIIAEAFNTAPTTQKVINEYKKLIGALGDEITILTREGIEDIAKISGSRVAEGVSKVRKGDLVIDPGYDGVYGVVKIWDHGGGEVSEQKDETPQLGLFD